MNWKHRRNCQNQRQLFVLHLLNKDFNNDFTIKKYQEIGYIFLNNQKSYEKVVTEDSLT